MLDNAVSGGKVSALDGDLTMELAQELAYYASGYTLHSGAKQPCADDLPIAYVTWDDAQSGGYSDVVPWWNVRFWKVEE